MTLLTVSELFLTVLPYEMSPFIVLFVVFVLLICLDFKYVKNAKRLPGPVRYPFVGNGHMFCGDSAVLLRTIGNLVRDYGERLRVYIMSTLYVLLVNPKDIESILSSTEVISKSEDYNHLHPWLGRGLLTSTGQYWKSHRKFLTPGFHFNILLNFLPIFDKNEKILIRKLKKVADGTPVDVFPLVALAALDNVSESAMGVLIDAQNDSESKYVKAVKVISELVFKTMRHPILRYNWIFNRMPCKTTQNQALKVLHGFSLDVIRSRRRTLEMSGITLQNYSASDTGMKKKCAFLDLLLLSEIDGKKLSDEAIREEVDTFMFEGHDTTTSGISFALYCISQHQNIQETLYEEQQSIFGDDKDRTITHSDLTAMSYLELVIKETLRLYPSVPIIARHVNADIHIAGLDLPKGTNIVISMFHMQRLSSVFQDPLEFRPERFLADNISQRSPYSWIAFSAGPRNCIGQKFAMMEMKVVLSSILRNFILKPSGVEPLLCADLILRSQNGVLVNFHPRS